MTPMGHLALYDNVDSTNANKVRFLLAELGLDYETRTLRLHDTPPEYRQVHPFGLVPALVDGELMVTESNVALRYLAEREGRHDLRGEDPVRRARIDVVLDSLSLELRPALWEVERFMVYGEVVDDRSDRLERLSAAASAYDRLLDVEGPFALGTFTIADCAIAGRCLHLERLGLGNDVAPRLRRVLAAAHARPSWAGVMQSR
jgi:glutathione S-transferase